MSQMGNGLMSKIYRCVLFIGMAVFWGTMYIRRPIREATELRTSGKQAVATVSDYKLKPILGRKKRVTYLHSHQLTFDEHTEEKLFDKQYPIGTKFDIVYSPSKPDLFCIGQKSDSFLDCFAGLFESRKQFWENIGIFSLILLGAVYTTCDLIYSTFRLMRSILLSEHDA